MPEVIKISNAQSVSMSDDWYELTDPNHFWIQWRFNVVINQLSPFLTKESRILEIGCGNGLVMKQFADNLGRTIEGCDLNTFAINNLVKDLSGTVYLYDIYDRNPDLIGQYDVIILLDVIEHIENDSAFLAVALEHLKTDGILVVSVPAHQWLFSNFDLQVGHKRRYSLKEINRLFHELDLVDIHSNYWGGGLFPLVLIRKFYLIFNKKNMIRKGFKPPHALFNKVALIMMKLEIKLFQKPIFGSSVIAIGRKNSPILT
ncbi:MAG: hypothetical protein CVT99_00265 [Bacteroidetes bacterium HGW-Bacteroidetes-16]|jgi:SAM-dependent methyltransferase|nr:MAG: hypothetical protein CVT99_00265 [Bacteroidetes bacterium HGW-Bacteroidetes-16]